MCRKRIVVAVVFSILGVSNLVSPPVFSQTATAPGARVATRAELIKETRTVIEGELKENGGTWDAWADRLKPFRADLERIRSTSRWPWPAKNDFQYQGREMDLLLQVDLSSRPVGQNPLKSIVRLHEQLKARGIDLIVMPIPDKMSIYPDYLSKEAPADRNVALPVRRLMWELVEKDIEVVDLQKLYQEFRRKDEDKTPLYYVKDAHWRNLGAQLAAKELAGRLARYDFAAAAVRANPYVTEPHERTDGIKADNILVVRNKQTGKMYADVGDSPVILTGDSFALYNMNPNAMGTISAHVAANIGMPLTLLSREGLSGDVPLELAKLEKDKGYLKGRRVVIWTFCTRMFVAAKWPMVDLPTAQVAATQLANQAVVARGEVAAMSAAPAKDAPYPNYIMSFHVVGLTDEAGKPLAGGGDAVVRVLALKDRKALPAAEFAKGQKLRLKLVPWDTVRKQHGTIMVGTLSDAQLEVDKPLYWAETAEKE